MAEEISIPALAGPSIPARSSLTKVHSGLTVMASESLLTAALQWKKLEQQKICKTIGFKCIQSICKCNHLITVDSVNAGSSIEARTGSAVVIIGLTEPAAESTSACAGERVDIVLTGRPVLARVLCTLVHIFLTVLATEAVNAETLKNIKIIDCNKVEYFKFRFMY